MIKTELDLIRFLEAYHKMPYVEVVIKPGWMAEYLKSHLKAGIDYAGWRVSVVQETPGMVRVRMTSVPKLTGFDDRVVETEAQYAKRLERTREFHEQTKSRESIAELVTYLDNRLAKEEQMAVESGKWLRASEVQCAKLAGLGRMVREFKTIPGGFGHPALLAAFQEYDVLVEASTAASRPPGLVEFLRRCRLLEKHMPTPAAILVDNQEEP